jgi:hypothetical protein
METGAFFTPEMGQRNEPEFTTKTRRHQEEGRHIKYQIEHIKYQICVYLLKVTSSRLSTFNFQLSTPASIESVFICGFLPCQLRETENGNRLCPTLIRKQSEKPRSKPSGSLHG